LRNVKLLYGGGGAEHEISIRSKEFIAQNLKGVCHVEEICLTKENLTKTSLKLSKDDFIIPCVHGVPGESGELPALLESMNIPFLGCDSKASVLCFNKVMTKTFLEEHGVKTTPFIALSKDDPQLQEKAFEFFNYHGNAFVKASSEGSSIGCYPVKEKEDLLERITQAFQYSNQVLLERMLIARELEVAAYEYRGKLYTTKPGEIISVSKFYSYDEKYSKDSSSQAKTLASNLSTSILEEIDITAQKIFKLAQLKDLSRIDFFLEGEKLYLNEVNTFPGMTSISLFPKMLELDKICSFQEFLKQFVRA